MRSNLRSRRGVVLGVVLVCAFGGVVFGQPWDGNGVEGDPYQIWTAADMQAIGADSNYLDAHFKLMADIDLGGYTGTSYNIIGNSTSPFSGVFDGNGHIVSNFTYDSNGTNYIGVFGVLDGESAEVKDLILVDPNVEAGTGDYVGAAVGWLINGTLSGFCAEGGIVSGAEHVGGLVGRNDGTVADCYSSSDVAAGGRDDMGVGGLVGSNYLASATVTGCYSTGNVSGDKGLGGLVGSNYRGTVSNCYSRGSVWGTDDDIGGLVGYSGGWIVNCYSTGAPGPGWVGGFVGFNGGTISGCFWDSESSGRSNMCEYEWVDVGASGCDDDGGKTTAEMQDANTFLDSGWDFVGESTNGTEDIWRLCSAGVDYPRLAWEFFFLGDFGCPDGVDGIDLGVLCEEWLFQELSADVWPDGGDGFVDFLDWAIFADGWGDTYDIFDLADFAGEWLRRGIRVADIAPYGGDGIVNVLDYAVLAENWLAGI